MIVEKNKQQQARRIQQQQQQQLTTAQDQFHRPRRLIGDNSVIDQGTNGNGGHEEEEDEGDNDEENIVIDMQDEDDEEDEDAEESGVGTYNNYQHSQEHYESGHFVSAYTTNNNNLELVNKSLDKSLKHEIQFESQFEGQCDMAFQFNIGDLVWFDPNSLGYSIPGKVTDYYPDLKVLTIEGYAQTAGDLSDLSRHNKLLLQADQELQVYDLSDWQQFKTIKLRQPLIDEQGVANLVDLEELSLESIIWNLKLRYRQELVYTSCGQKILISVNPYKQLCDIYNLDQVNKYDTIDTNKLRSLTRFCPSNEAASPDPQSRQNQCASSLIRWLLLHEQPFKKSQQEPHIFQLANEALKKLLISGQDQSFVLLGESGSGKTEACKLLIQYLATVNKSPTNLMTEQILESIQVLESFGNAKTIHNDNSSRFGKLLDVRFDLFSGFIIDAKTIDLNLLDRTRIVSQSENERNYHIFYELLTGLSKHEKEKYGLQTAEKYFYLNQGHCVDLPGKEDGDDFRSLLASMQVLGFNYQEQDTIFRLLASVLHLGNIYFHRKVLAVRSGKLAQQQQQTQPPTNVAGVEGVEIGSDTEVRWVSHLLQIQFDSVMRCLTVRTSESTTSVSGNSYTAEAPQVVVDRIVTPLNIDQALDTRDAIARTLYNCLFKWLIQRINVMINGTDTNDKSQPLRQPQSQSSSVKQEPIYLCRTSESLCEFQPDKLQPDSRQSSLSKRGQPRSVASSSTINSSKSNRKQQHQQAQYWDQQRFASATISILDAFGFENLSENNFEQLCINYTAELLNYHTSRYLIRLEQAEYIKERLRWTPLSVLNHAMNNNNLQGGSNSMLSASATTATSTSSSSNAAASIVNLISRKPLGILALLDDECNFPKATDQSFVEKCHHNHTLNENYQGARLAANCQEFGIKHFRQSSRLVWYQVEGFIEKNRDNLRQDIVELLVGSKMTIVADMLRKIHQTHGDHYGSNNSKTLSRTYDGRYVSMKPRATTVAARFQDALHNNRVLESINYSTSSTMNTQLPSEVSHYQTTKQAANNEYSFSACVASIGRPNPWFVICLKPNRSQSAQVFDVAYVQDQCKSLNLLEMSQMRKIGYPIRLRYGEFVRRYKCLVPQKFLNNLASCQDIQVANQKSIYEDRSSSQVQKSSNCEIKRAIRDVCRAIVEYRFIKQQQESLVKDQYQCGLTKMFLNEKLYYRIEEMRLNEHKKAIEILQKSLRMWLVRREFLVKRQAAIVIQAHVRGFIDRRDFWRRYMIIINLQRAWRRQLIVKRRKMLEAKRQAQRQRQQHLLQEVQAQQRKQSNQFRFRQVQTCANQATKKQAAGGHYATKPGLDIPEDLAQLYRLQRAWIPVHDLSHLNELNLVELLDREKKRCRKHRGNPLSVPFIVLNSAMSEKNDATMMKYIQELESNDNYSLQSFLLKYYTVEVAQFGYSRLPITRPFNWPQLARKRHVAIRTGVDVEENIRQRFGLVEQKAISIYKLILRYIDSDLDSNQSKERENNYNNSNNNTQLMQKLVKFKLIADYIIYLCLNEDLLRNEVYLQLASQSWQNPKLKSTENAWKLFANCMGCFEPTDKELTKYLLRYASDYCCDKYRPIALERLSYALMKQEESDFKLRKFPLTMLEYLANEQAIGRFALAASCYMDDHALNGPIPLDFEPNIEDVSATNQSNKTFVRIRPQTTAEQLASAVLSAREVPRRNLLGWSVEVQHEAAQSDFSSRLRGDDYLLDHFSRLELLPEFTQLFNSNSELCTESMPETSSINDHLNTVQQTLFDPYSMHQQTESEHYFGAYRQPFNSRARKLSLTEIQGNTQKNRLSLASQRSFEANFGGNKRNSSASSDIERPIAGKLSQTSKLNRRYIQDQEQLQYSDLGYPTNLNRRSMSMQELQLASSALNGRYFQQQPQQQLHHQPQPQGTSQGSNHYASSYVSSQSGRGPAGSLQQLAATHQAYLPASTGRRRSQTPNSVMFGTRMSSSAYGSETYASSHFTSPAGATFEAGAGEMEHMKRRSRVESSFDRASRSGRPRRSASSSSRPSRGLMLNQAPGSDYASAHSDYERTAKCVKPNQQQLYNQSRNQSKNQPSRQLADTRPKNPLVDRISKPIRSQVSGRNLRGAATNQLPMQEQHYVASSAMSDTSEAPSLASHVRGIKVPQNNGDLDQYLDDLFNPMLDEVELDELSDARSLATSIRGHFDPELEKLSQLGSARALSKLIRGSDAEPEQEEQKEQKELPREPALSPTFESLLKSLKEHENVAATTTGLVGVSSREAGELMSQLSGMNLKELKALNQKLEDQIQAAQLNRASFNSDQSTSGFGFSPSGMQIPAPPPQPSFCEPTLEDIYSRAKTVRIGKWRWPPAEGESGPAEESEQAAAIFSYFESRERKRLSQVSSNSSEQTAKELPSTPEQVVEDQDGAKFCPSSNQAALLNVGKLKISSEMKAKLEQLTTSGSSSSGSVREPSASSGVVSQLAKSVESRGATSSGDESQGSAVKQLMKQRKNLLENQLLGAKVDHQNANRVSTESTGSKILATKQQLAAAAGVALAALGGNSANSSRPQSGQVDNPAASKSVKSDERNSRALQDELGPQSQAAISQRQAFYQLSASSDQLDNLATGPAKSEHGGSEVQLREPAEHILPPTSAISSDNIQQKAQSGAAAKIAPTPGLTRAMQVSSNLNEVGQSSELGKECDRLYGRSVALSLSQRQHESLASKLKSSGLGAGAGAGGESQWVSSSPDRTLESSQRNLVRRRESSKRLLSVEPQPQQQSSKRRATSERQKQSNHLLVAHEIPAQDIPARCLSYANVDWQIKIRKEFFLPSETYDDPLVVQLIFAQLVADVFNPRHWTRLNNKERAAMKALMKDNSIGYAPSLPQIGQMESVKRDLVRMARSFGLYFTRSYPAQNYALIMEPNERSASHGCSRKETRPKRHSSMARDSCGSSSSSCSSSASPTPAVEHSEQARRLVRRLEQGNNLGTDWLDMVAVHHSGLRLVSVVSSSNNEQQAAAGGPGRGWQRGKQTDSAATQQAAGTAAQFGYRVLETLKYRDMSEVSQVGQNELLVSMRNGKKCWLISSEQSVQLVSLLKCFHADYNDHLNSSQERNPAAQGNNFGASSQKKSAKATATTKAKHHLNNKDALLAIDDDHHGDHFEERQTSNGFSGLHQAAHSNNDLVDDKRVLSNNLANNNSKTKQQLEQQQQQHFNINNSSNSGSGNVKSSSNNKHLSPPTSPSAKFIDRAANEPAELRHSSGVPLDSSSRNEPQKKQQQQTNNNKQSNKGNKKNSLWQNSLSRMSNKFSIFGGSQSRATGNSADIDKQKSVNLANNNTAQLDSNINNPASRSSQVALDAWIETKVDFDEDEDENGSGGPSSNNLGEPQEATSPTDHQTHQQQSLVSQASAESSSSSSAAKKQSSIESQQKSSGAESAKNEADGKYSLLQFALYNFREAIDKYSLETRASKVQVPGDTSTLRGSLKLIETLRNVKNSNTPSNSSSSNNTGKESRKSSRLLPSVTSLGNNNNDWTWRELAEMVKYTKVPIKQSLLKLQNEDLNKRAVDCFYAIMQYMGDAPIPAAGNLSKHYSHSSDQVECVYLILMNCHNFPVLRDEIYCQLMKQTTNNRSANPDSCLMGWRLFSIVAAYFDCSEPFKPYLLKYLETAAYDKRRAYCSVASLCLQNLRKTFKFSGRKNVPSIEEIAATSAGRNSKRQIYRLPGGTERVINTKSTTVVDDIIHEICSNMLNITDPDEMLEFSLYCIADGDLYTMPLNRDEYILDITTELIKNHQQYFLIFCRSIWHYPLRLDSKLYIEVIFNQIAPDYLEGLLLVLPNLKTNRQQQEASRKPFRLKSKLVKEIARIAALLHRASGTDHMPHKDEVKYLLPKPIITAIKQYQRSLNNNQSLATVSDQSGSSAGSSGSGLGRHMNSLERPHHHHQSIDDHDEDDQVESTDTVVTTPQKWIELVQANWREMSAFDTLDAKAQFLVIVRHWPLFGSSFFAIKLIQRDLIQPIDFILALNKLGIQMLDKTSHETIHKYSFNEVISTRKVRSEDGALFLDLKCGNLMKRTIIRIQTDQAHEISRLIRQYIDIELLQQKQHHNSHQQRAMMNSSTNLQSPDSPNNNNNNNNFINHDEPLMVNRGSGSESG